MNKYKKFITEFDLVDYVSAHYEVRSIGSRHFILCPFHEEKTPSCLIDKESYYCFGCAKSGSSLNFLKDLTGQESNEIINNLEYLSVPHIDRPAQNKVSIPPSLSLINRYHKSLLRQPDKMTYLYDRHFDDNSIRQARIGYGVPIDFKNFKRPRYSIPHFDGKKLVGVRYRIDPAYNDEDKYISHPGAKGVIYNINALYNHDTIVYCGSQLDAAVLHFRYNIPSIAPPSENTFKSEWIILFRNKNILIWLDNDATGRDASLRVYQNLKDICHAQIFQWTNEFKDKDDIKDFLDLYSINGVQNVLYYYNLL